MVPRRWIVLRIAVPSSHQELLSGTLAVHGVAGFLQQDATLECTIPKAMWTAKFRTAFEDQLLRFAEQFPELDLPYTATVVREENWNKKWEDQAGIVEATRRIIIKPSWKKLRKKDRGKLVLHIDPKMAFGTGHHETTRLCMHLTEDFLHGHPDVLDFGCGTGVLAIAAAKLGARRVWAIDNDPWAIPNARENVKRNHVERAVRVALGSISRVPDRSFPLIVANIDFPTISRFLKPLTRRLERGGMILLSGVLATDMDALTSLAASLRLVPVQYIRENEWIAAAFAKS